jgi:hypothetical protein
MGALANGVISDWERGESDRSVFLTHWQDVANYELVNRNDYITTRVPGQKRMTYVYDASPIWAAEQLAAGLHSLLTSTSLPWFYLWPDSEALMQIDRVRVWLEVVSAVMYGLFNGSRHNFASQSHEIYLDLATIGTGAMAVLESDRSGVLFSTRHMKECVIAENEEDRIDQNIRRWQWTAKQAVQCWGRAAGEKVSAAFNGDKPNQKFTFLHAVRPRKERDSQRGDKLNMEWESVYVSLEDKAEISVGGFPEFPYLIPRFSKCTGETYGRGPGMIALPDVKMLNEMKKTLLKAAQKVVDPPLQVPDSSFLMQIKTVPGSINYYREGSAGRIEPIETKGQIQLGIELLNALQAQILKTFYVEWLIMPSDLKDPASSGKGVTATYVLQQRDEKMRLLSPMLARLQSEFLGPLIDRVFAILWRKSKRLNFGPGSPFPPPPPELSGVPLRVEYVSPIALAQKSSQMDGVTRLMQIQTALKQMDPQSATVLDGEYILRLAQKDFYAPVKTLKSPEQLQQEAEAAQQALAQQQQGENIASIAGAAKDGAGALKNIAQAVPMKEAA